MPVSNDPRVVSIDVSAMQEAIQETVEGSLRSLVEFDKDEFNTLYVDDLSMQFYEDEDEMMAHFEEIHSYVHLDFTEKRFYREDIFPVADRVRYLATGFDVFTALRIYFDDEGLFLMLDRDEPVEPVVAAAESVYDAEK
ncbi:hypothetical protein [Halobacterium wangiae]|uniref:hypothetical protein n=1 Tax=Halobacterium wangiae TaxID=2902623 RepID=UPI001E355836|nr:hypothetical protein [Halobacterium wangiae]